MSLIPLESLQRLVDRFDGDATPRGRVAFYAAARQIYLEEPRGSKGFWDKLGRLEAPMLSIWGKHDGLVPIGFATHVRRTLPAAHHLELDCGHVPQIERSEETHTAIVRFLREASLGECGDAPGLLAG